ncbi:MAG: PepSY domain-containing protein, partial [Alphaproteobacteria bacterium]
NIATQPVKTLNTVTPYLDPARLAGLPGARGARQATLRHLLNRPVYEVETEEGPRLFDAVTGERLDPLPEDTARALAARDFGGEGGIASAELLKERPAEYRAGLPVWQVQFTDELNTRIYVSAATGEVTARRNAIWRLFDFFWMLHIMDYDDRTNFNNPLIKTASATGFVFALSGLALVILRLGAGRYMMDLRRLFRLRRRQR